MNWETDGRWYRLFRRKTYTLSDASFILRSSRCTQLVNCVFNCGSLKTGFDLIKKSLRNDSTFLNLVTPSFETRLLGLRFTSTVIRKSQPTACFLEKMVACKPTKMCIIVYFSEGKGKILL